MPRKKFWRRGLTSKKGLSHPSNHGLTSDVDMGSPPIQNKVQNDSDMGSSPIQSKVPSDSDMGSPPIQDKVLNSLRAPSTDNDLQSNLRAPSTDNDSQSSLRAPSFHNDLQSSLRVPSSHNQSQSIQNEQSNYETSSEHSGQVHDVSEAENTYFASHNQADTMYSSFSRGSQCTCMLLSMILGLQDETHLSTDKLDLVLHHGDNLYRKVVLDFQNTGKFRNSLLGECHCWWTSESPRAHVAKFYGRLRLIRSVLRASKFSVFKILEIVILWVYYTFPFGFSFVLHFLVITFQLFK